MAPSKDTRVLFVPYRPGTTTRKYHDAGEISQQKHAAREYHRKAKQRRQTLKDTSSSSYASYNGSISSTSESPEFRSVQTARPSTYWRSESTVSSTRDRSVSLPMSPRNILGAGRIDPMNSLPLSDMSPYAQEMLDFCRFLSPQLVYC